MSTRVVVSHTRGPWRVAEGELCRWSGGEVIRPSAGDGVDSPVAFVCDFNRYDRDEERQANARLIAAAPRMLVVLEDVLASADADMEPFDIDEVRAVVAEAKGRPR